MKRFIPWIAAIAFVIFIIDWGVIGLKLLDSDYNITTGVYIGAACYVIILLCAVCKIFGNRCPHCNRHIDQIGTYCPYCGQKIR